MKKSHYKTANDYIVDNLEDVRKLLSDNSQCADCRYLHDSLDDGKPTCSAFPLGIPNKYARGGEKHNRKDKSQDGDFTFKSNFPIY